MTLQDKLVAWLDKELFVSEFNNPSSSFFVVEDDFVDMTTQTGSPIDTPKTVKYGTSKTSPNNLVSIDNSGVISVLKTGPYFIKTRHRVGRTGSSGISRLFFWIEIAPDGVNWVVSGNSVEIRLDNSDEVQVFFDATPIYLQAGFKVRARFARSSTGTNFGDLMPSAPSSVLQNLGVPPVPSAQLSIYRSNNWNYTNG